MEPVHAIHATCLTRRFRAGFLLRPRVAVDGLDLRVAPGGSCAILGPNGSGKSTTLRLAAGLLTPHGGTLRVFGRAPGHAELRGRVAYLPESEEAPAWLRAREVLDLFGVLWGIPRVERRRRVRERLDRVGLGADADRRVGGFSKGMQRRLSIARALLPETELLLLDEPGEGLDAAGLEDLRAMLLEEKRRGATLVVAGHLREEVDGICDEALALERGRRVDEGGARDVLDRVVARALAGRSAPEA